MFNVYIRRLLLSGCFLFFSIYLISAQSYFKLKYKNSSVYAGIDVGSKGVKLSLLEIGKNAKKSGAFNVLKDTAVNTDFISFTQPTFQATLNALYKLYISAIIKSNAFKWPSKTLSTSFIWSLPKKLSMFIVLK